MDIPCYRYDRESIKSFLSINKIEMLNKKCVEKNKIVFVFVFKRTNIDLLEKIQQKYTLKLYQTR